MSLGFKRLKNI